MEHCLFRATSRCHFRTFFGRLHIGLKIDKNWCTNKFIIFFKQLDRYLVGGFVIKKRILSFYCTFFKFCPHILNGRDAKLTLTFPFLSRWIEYMYEHDNQKYYFFKEKWMNTTYIYCSKVKDPNFCTVYHKKLKIIHNNWNKYTPRKKKNLITSILHIYYNYCYIEKYFSSFSRFVICNNIFVLKKWIYSWRCANLKFS